MESKFPDKFFSIYLNSSTSLNFKEFVLAFSLIFATFSSGTFFIWCSAFSWHCSNFAYTSALFSPRIATFSINLFIVESSPNGSIVSTANRYLIKFAKKKLTYYNTWSSNFLADSSEFYSYFSDPSFWRVSTRVTRLAISIWWSAPWMKLRLKVRSFVIK